MNVVLIMVRDNGERRSFALTRDSTLIGRREDADFRIPLTDVSRKHCRLIIDGNALILEDLGSSNGTLHNGERVTEAELAPGDTLQIGPVRFVVQIDGSPAEDAAEPVRLPRSSDPANGSNSLDSSVTRSYTPPPPVPSFDDITDDGGADREINLDVD